MAGMEERLVGTVKGPGETPHEYSFITTNNEHTRVGEFVFYNAVGGDADWKIVGTITGRKLVRGLPDSFLVDPRTPPAEVSNLLGLPADNAEIFEISVETIGYFNDTLNDFINPRIPPMPGQSIHLASNDMLTSMLSPRRKGESGGAHIGSLLTRGSDDVPIVLSVREVVSTHLAVLASTGSGKSYLAGVLLEELLMPHNRAAVLIIDPHGEYGTLQEIHQHPGFSQANYHPEVKIFTPDKIKVRLSSLTESDIVYLLPEMTEKMRSCLSQAFRALINTRGRGERGLWGFQDLLTEVRPAIRRRRGEIGWQCQQHRGAGMAAPTPLRAGPHIFRSRKSRSQRPFPTRTMHHSSALGYRRDRTAGHRRRAPAKNQQGTNGNRARQRARRRRIIPAISSLCTTRGIPSLRTGRGEGRLDRHPETDPLRRA
jgi:hypothetical protein